MHQVLPSSSCLLLVFMEEAKEGLYAGQPGSIGDAGLYLLLSLPCGVSGLASWFWQRCRWSGRTGLLWQEEQSAPLRIGCQIPGPPTRGLTPWSRLLRSSQGTGSDSQSPLLLPPDHRPRAPPPAL